MSASQLLTTFFLSTLIFCTDAAAAPSGCSGCEADVTSSATIVTYPDGSQTMNTLAKIEDGTCLIAAGGGCKDGNKCKFRQQWSYSMGPCGTGTAVIGYRIADADTPENNDAWDEEQTLPANSGVINLELTCNSTYYSLVKITTACNPPQTHQAESSANCTACLPD